MKIVFNIFGGLLAALGLIWSLQGANVLPGSGMSGQTFWLVTGLIVLIVGIGLLWFANRRKTSPPPQV